MDTTEWGLTWPTDVQRDGDLGAKMPELVHLLESKPHVSAKPHSCEFCRKAFVSHSHLMRHRVVHTNEKPHTCDVCGRSFTQRHSLIAHTYLHRNEKPYKCIICRKAFTNTSAMNLHVRSIHGRDPKQMRGSHRFPPL